MKLINLAVSKRVYL